MAAEEVLAHEGAVVGLHRLVVAVDHVHHHLAQDAVLVALQERIPVAAPDQLDDVPAGAAELALELLDDLAVAAHRAVEALQVAVDDEDQVVELLARGQADGAERLGLVHLAVAAEHPDLAVLGVGDAARVQVLEEARLVDRHQRAEAHRDGGELPELRHQLRMRVARDALAVDLLAEVQQLLFGQAPFHVGPRIHAGRRVALDVEQVAAVLGRLGVPEVVEAGAEHRRQRGEARDVAAEVAAVGGMEAIRLDHHRHRVPAHVGAQPLLDLDVAGASLFLVGGDGVDVRRLGRERQVDAGLARLVDQLLEQEVGALAAFRSRSPPRGRRATPGFHRRRCRRSRPRRRKAREGLTWASPESLFSLCASVAQKCTLSHSAISFRIMVCTTADPSRISMGSSSLGAASIIGGMQRAVPATTTAPPRPDRTWAERLFGRWWRRQSAARQDRYATLGPLASVLLFLAAIVSAFWYLRNEELEREQEAVRARHRGGAAAAAPAPDRQPRAAGPHRARPGHPLARPRFLPRPGLELHPRAAGDHQPDLGRAGAQCVAAYSGTSFPPETGISGIDDAGVAADRELRQRAREGLPARPRDAPDGLLAALQGQLRQPGVPGRDPADRARPLQRRADRRVLGRAAAALLRADRGLAPACDLAARPGPVAGEHRDDRARHDREAAVDRLRAAGRAGRERPGAARRGLPHLRRPDQQHPVLDGDGALGAHRLDAARHLAPHAAARCRCRPRWSPRPTSAAPWRTRC